MLRRYAKRMEFEVLTTFKRHQKANTRAVVLDDPCVGKLKLFAKLRSFFRFVPEPAGRRDRNAHGAEKHVGQKRKVVIGCLARSYHDLSLAAVRRYTEDRRSRTPLEAVRSALTARNVISSAALPAWFFHSRNNPA